MGTHDWFGHMFLNCGSGLQVSASPQDKISGPQDPLIQNLLAQEWEIDFLSSIGDGSSIHQCFERYLFIPNSTYPWNWGQHPKWHGYYTMGQDHGGCQAVTHLYRPTLVPWFSRWVIFSPRRTESGLGLLILRETILLRGNAQDVIRHPSLSAYKPCLRVALAYFLESVSNS